MQDLVSAVVLGIIQGVFEWLPVSSKTALMLFTLLVLKETPVVSYIVGLALQGGTVLAALMYFRRDVLEIVIFRNKKLLMFIAVATATSALVALPLYFLTITVLGYGNEVVAFLTLLVGFVLVVQALVLKRLAGGTRQVQDVTIADSIITGVFQALSVLPGISRSGITLIALLHLKFRVRDALKMSFLLSIPVNAGATIFTYLEGRATDVCADPFFISIPLVVSALIGFTLVKVMIKAAETHGYKLAVILGTLAIVVGLILLFSPMPYTL